MPARDVANYANMTLRQAALITGVALALMTLAAPYAELYVYSKLVVPGDIEATIGNLVYERDLFLSGIFAYLVTFIMDVIVAWGLYVLLIPVSRSLSLLTAVFRIVYTVIAFFALAKLVTAFRLLNTPDFGTVFGPDQLQAQVQMLLNGFRYEWHMGLILFGLHLGMLGYLIVRSGYIPAFLGYLLGVSMLGYLIYYVSPLFSPSLELDYLMITFFAEPVLMIWLLARGWAIEERVAGRSG
ncbi:MAG: DUF4386 domain-containing protein [Woeseiaceae bacterium]|nr:DUF4386 domain-containing protein [Woeseiaceae bacterium]